MKILGRLVEKKELTDDEINNMTWQQKSDLILQYPVTCARNFEDMVQLFIKYVVKSNLMPIGEIVLTCFIGLNSSKGDHLHMHALFWVSSRI